MDKRGFETILETLANGDNATMCVRVIINSFVGHGINGMSPKTYDCYVENIAMYDDGIIICDVPRKRDTRINKGQINEKRITKAFAIDIAIPYSSIIAMETIPQELAEERTYL